jgi:hypothetical protein
MSPGLQASGVTIVLFFLVAAYIAANLDCNVSATYLFWSSTIFGGVAAMRWTFCAHYGISCLDGNLCFWSSGQILTFFFGVLLTCILLSRS